MNSDRLYNDYNTKNIDFVNDCRRVLSHHWHITYMPHVEKTIVVDKLGEVPAQYFETFAEFETWAKKEVGQ